MNTFNLRLNNCIDILADLTMINSRKADELRNRIAIEDTSAYKEILVYLEKLKEYRTV